MNSPTPWSVDREPWMDFYLIKDAEGNVIGKIESRKTERKPQSFQLQPDMEIAHANAHLICLKVNQYGNTL
jgi:hypothetical protein